MRRALELAAQGRGRVEPNPPVGAVIVHRGKLVGEGFHERFGGPHAEIRAMDAAAGACRGATLYVTLEPCTGLNKKTPPCCDAVLKAGFRRVVIGASDPTQESAAARLQAAGIAVLTGVLEPECRQMIAPFLKLRARGMPWVIAKWAMTADGKIATVTGQSRWISSEASRDLVHQWRNQADAVLVGIGTVLRDDPLLTCRPFEFPQGGPEQMSKGRIDGGRNPLRIVLDAEARIPLTSRLVATAREAPLVVAFLDLVPEARRRQLAHAGCRVLPLNGVRARGRGGTLARARRPADHQPHDRGRRRRPCRFLRASPRGRSPHLHRSETLRRRRRARPDRRRRNRLTRRRAEARKPRLDSGRRGHVVDWNHQAPITDSQ